MAILKESEGRRIPSHDELEGNTVTTVTDITLVTSESPKLFVSQCSQPQWHFLEHL